MRHTDVDFNNLILKVFGKVQRERLLQGSRSEKRNSSTSPYLMLRKLGLPMFGWHGLRHTFATNYLRHGGDIVRLSMVLGHTQITTTSATCTS